MRVFVLLLTAILLPTTALALDPHAGALEDRSNCTQTYSNEWNQTSPDGSEVERYSYTEHSCDVHRDVADAGLSQDGQTLASVEVGTRGQHWDDKSGWSRVGSYPDYTHHFDSTWGYQDDSTSSGIQVATLATGTQTVDVSRCESHESNNSFVDEYTSANSWGGAAEGHDSTTGHCSEGIYTSGTGADQNVDLVQCDQTQATDSDMFAPTTTSDKSCSLTVATGQPLPDGSWSDVAIVLTKHDALACATGCEAHTANAQLFVELEGRTFASSQTLTGLPATP